MCFIDYAKAFDCVSHGKLSDAMEQMGFPVHIIQLVASMYTAQSSVVRTSNGDTDWFKIERVVRQGCAISPVLYTIYSEHIRGEARRTAPKDSPPQFRVRVRLGLG